MPRPQAPRPAAGRAGSTGTGGLLAKQQMPRQPWTRFGLSGQVGEFSFFGIKKVSGTLGLRGRHIFCTRCRVPDTFFMPSVVRWQQRCNHRPSRPILIRWAARTSRSSLMSVPVRRNPLRRSKGLEAEKPAFFCGRCADAGRRRQSGCRSRRPHPFDLVQEGDVARQGFHGRVHFGDDQRMARAWSIW
jgi:hypothetical protein